MHDCLVKVIHWELCKKFNFDQINYWYISNPEEILENKTHKILWDFEIQKEHLISTTWPDFVIVKKKKKKKKNLMNSGLCRSGRPQSQF